jgi:hypothetical protein
MDTVQWLAITLTLTFGICDADPLARYQPEQIHLSLGGKLKVLNVFCTKIKLYILGLMLK